MKKLKNIHPGEILKEEFLEELGISMYRLAKDTGIPQTWISEIVKGAAPDHCGNGFTAVEIFWYQPQVLDGIAG